MAWNDPLRRYEMAERLRLLKEAGDGASAPDAAVGARRRERRMEPTVELTEEELQRLIARAVADAAPPPEARPAPTPAWTDTWWTPGTGPTEHALRVLGGDDGRALAWVLAGRTGLPLVAVEERQVGSRMGFWVRRHVAVDMLDGRCLDVSGARTRDALVEAVAAARTGRRRLVRLSRRTRWADVADGSSGAEAAHWQESLVEATPEAVELVAGELAARHGLPARD